MMKNVTRLVSNSSSFISPSISPVSSITGRKAAPGSVRLVQVNAVDKSSKKKSPEDSPNLMEVSFGEGYATRSEEEGFGGIYGGKCNGECEVEAKAVADAPQIDIGQGCQVKEKEKARNRTRAD